MKILRHERVILENSFWLSRILFNRALSSVQFIAFLIAFLQNSALLGTNGLTPAIQTMQLRHEYFKTPTEFYNFNNNPLTLFWFIEANDLNLALLAFLGMILSSYIVLQGQSNIIINFILWILYLSIVNIGNVWYSFGWESQLLETTFLSMLLVPLLSLDRFPKWTKTSFVGIWGNKWLLFRIMIGAGLIKIRSDPCWTDLTCMNYHYLTQPVPGPTSTLYHSTPESFHQFETIVNHIVELILPWLLLIPQREIRHFGAISQIGFQFILISSGNLSYLNWLTIVPAILCLDDCFLASLGLFGREDVYAAYQAEKKYRYISYPIILSIIV